MLQRQGKLDEAERELWASIEIARNQGAKPWELRATTALARLMMGRGDRDTARDLLRPIYDWFTEGFSTRDLMNAKALLNELS
jgi:predicted ATPase